MAACCRLSWFKGQVCPDLRSGDQFKSEYRKKDNFGKHLLWLIWITNPNQCPLLNCYGSGQDYGFVMLAVEEIYSGSSQIVANSTEFSQKVNWLWY